MRPRVALRASRAARGWTRPREQLLAAYARHAGATVPIAELRRWELIGTLRWGVICVMQASTHLSGARRSVEHAVIGRRACEVEWDLLDLLAPPGRGRACFGGAGRGAAEPAAPARQTERRGAARSGARALGEHVLPLLEGRSAFELRVTLRALGIVRRELEHAGEHTAMHAAALARLGGAGRGAAGARDPGAASSSAHDAQLHAALRAIVRAKLEVANPGYLQTETHRKGGNVSEELPRGGAGLMEEIDAFIESEVRPLEAKATTPASSIIGASTLRTDFEAGGIPRREWEELLEEMVERADRAGLWRYALPEELGGRGGSNLTLAIVREHLNRLGIGPHNDPQSEISLIGNFPTVILAHEFGTPAQQEVLVERALRREAGPRVRPDRAGPRLRRDLHGDGAPPAGRAG